MQQHPTKSVQYPDLQVTGKSRGPAGCCFLPRLFGVRGSMKRITSLCSGPKYSPLLEHHPEKYGLAPYATFMTNCSQAKEAIPNHRKPEQGFFLFARFFSQFISPSSSHSSPQSLKGIFPQAGNNRFSKLL